jgi:LemA protein
MEVVIVVAVILVVVLLYVWATYNGLVKLNVRVEEAWSGITVQLKRRADLIPNLVEAVKGYSKHEKGVFDDVTKARSAILAGAKQGPEAAAKAEGQFEQALKSLFAVAENYPNLQASQNFLDLQNELTDAEDKIQAARRFYNGGVRDLNIKIKVFPANIFARKLGFGEKEFFEVKDREAIEEPVKVAM